MAVPTVGGYPKKSPHQGPWITVTSYWHWAAAGEAASKVPAMQAIAQIAGSRPNHQASTAIYASFLLVPRGNRRKPKNPASQRRLQIRYSHHASPPVLDKQD